MPPINFSEEYYRLVLLTVIAWPVASSLRSSPCVLLELLREQGKGKVMPDCSESWTHLSPPAPSLAQQPGEMWGRPEGRMDKNSGITLPEFETWHCHLQLCDLVQFILPHVPQFPHLWNSRAVQLMEIIGLLWEINVLKFVKSLGHAWPVINSI